jgi:transposase
MIPARFVEDRMKRFIEGADRGQSTLFPECVEDWIGEDNPVRVVDAFVDELDLAELDSAGLIPRQPAGLRIIHRYW